MRSLKINTLRFGDRPPTPLSGDRTVTARNHERAIGESRWLFSLVTDLNAAAWRYDTLMTLTRKPKGSQVIARYRKVVPAPAGELSTRNRACCHRPTGERGCRRAQAMTRLEPRRAGEGPAGIQDHPTSSEPLSDWPNAASSSPFPVPPHHGVFSEGGTVDVGECARSCGSVSPAIGRGVAR